MYVIKVGKYYVKDVDICNGFIGGIKLSKEIMRGFKDWKTANVIAESVNGLIIKTDDEVSNG